MSRILEKRERYLCTPLIPFQNVVDQYHQKALFRLYLSFIHIKFNMSKILTVFGATGNQGGSVIRAVLADSVLSKEFSIRGITRDVSKPAAKALASKGVDVRAVSKIVIACCSMI
jgi:hypothetical protein